MPNESYSPYTVYPALASVAAPNDPGYGHAGGTIDQWGNMALPIYISRAALEAAHLSPFLTTEEAVTIYEKCYIATDAFESGHWHLDAFGCIPVSPAYLLSNALIVQAFCYNYFSVLHVRIPSGAIEDRMYFVSPCPPPLDWLSSQERDYGTGAAEQTYQLNYEKDGDYYFYERVSVAWYTKVRSAVSRKIPSIIPILTGLFFLVGLSMVSSDITVQTGQARSLKRIKS